MKFGLSSRIGEVWPTKTRNALSFEDFAELATSCGYSSVSLRPSHVSPDTPATVLGAYRHRLDQLGLQVSTLTTSIDVVANTSNASKCLIDIGTHLDVARLLGARFLRVALQKHDEIPLAQKAADEARERGITLVHQTHANTLFETVEMTLAALRKIARANFAVIFEPANLLLCGDLHAIDRLPALAGHLAEVYVQNLRLRPDGLERLERSGSVTRFDRVPIWYSDGAVGLPSLLAKLRGQGFAGPVTLHAPAACPDDVRLEARRSREALDSASKAAPDLQEDATGSC